MHDELLEYLSDAVRGIADWEASWEPFERHPSLAIPHGALQDALARYIERLRGNYPFFHPRYAGQMLKPPHPVAALGYLAAMLINPNNHALDGGPPTSAMEKEVVASLTSLFGFPSDALGHLTSSGTIANLEALWVARELHPGKAIAYSRDAHYTHERMCAVLGVEGRAVPATARGEMDVSVLEQELRAGTVGTVVATAGTTGSGALDDIGAIADLCNEHGARVHVDAAYGGFFRLLRHSDVLTQPTAERLGAIERCDSVVVDPHKHGLQPYGCGAILFRDASVGRFYKHDSPYTYFTSDELHLGEISLECSRAGAAAGALWLTLQVLPLEADRGLGPVLAATRTAATTFARLLDQHPDFGLLREPALDIVAFFPHARHASEVDRLSASLFANLMNDADDPIFLSVLKVDSRLLEKQGVEADVATTRILRSVLMKPEHEREVLHLMSRLDDQLRATSRGGSK